MSDERQIGDFDNEYWDELLGKDPAQVEKEHYTTVAEHDPALAQQLVEATRNEIELKKQRARTYLSSELPVRPCTADCPDRDNCKDYQLGRVKDNELCRPQLRLMKKWQKHFRDGNFDALKDDVGTVAGGMAAMAMSLIKIINKEGPIYFKPTEWGPEMVAHPGIPAVSRIAKDLGIDLNSFLMTPKAVKDAGPQVHVNIGVSADDVQARFASRFGKKPIDIEVEVKNDEQDQNP